MTTITSEIIECPACKAEVKIHFIMSTNYMGPSDLDLRPPEMARSTIYQTTSVCKCGNVFRSSNSGGSQKLIESDDYKNCDGIQFQNEWPKIFYRAYLIDKESENSTIRSQLDCILRCAWACDDYSDENSSKVRLIAVDLINALLDLIQNMDDDEDEEYAENKKKYLSNNLLIKADLLRRSGQFDQLIEEYNDIKFGDDLYQKILDFQIEKSMEKDDKYYTVDDVLT